VKIVKKEENVTGIGNERLRNQTKKRELGTKTLEIFVTGVSPEGCVQVKGKRVETRKRKSSGKTKERSLTERGTR